MRHLKLVTMATAKLITSSHGSSPGVPSAKSGTPPFMPLVQGKILRHLWLHFYLLYIQSMCQHILSALPSPQFYHISTLLPSPLPCPNWQHLSPGGYQPPRWPLGFPLAPRQQGALVSSDDVILRSKPANGFPAGLALPPFAYQALPEPARSLDLATPTSPSPQIRHDTDPSRCWTSSHKRRRPAHSTASLPLGLWQVSPPQRGPALSSLTPLCLSS